MSMLNVLPLSLLFALASFTINGKELDSSSDSSLVLSIDVSGAITPTVFAYIQEAIATAEVKHAEALLINLDTPGGLYETTRDIVKDMLKSPVPIIVYIAPKGARAGSAGVFIAIAANIVAMAPSTNIGAAHPVGISGDDVAGDMKDKVTNDAKAWARAIAEARGKNALWAEKAVISSEAISAKVALEIGVIDFMANDVAEVLRKAHGKEVSQFNKTMVLKTLNAKVVSFDMTFAQAFMKFLANPNLLYILMMLGILGIFIEFQSPGLILPGLFGVFSLAIVFGVQILPINWFGALLIFGAVACFIAEIFITSFGLLGIGGLVLLILGSYLLFSVSGSNLFVEPMLIWLFSAGFTLIILTIGLVLWRSRKSKATANVYALVGKEGIVTEAISPPDSGSVLLQGSYWRAFSDEPIEKDQQVIVKRILSTKIFVERKARN